MSFLALHRGADTSLGSTRYLLDTDEVTACESAVQLLASLQSLHDTRQAELQAALASARAGGYTAGREEALRQVAPQLLAAWEQAAAQAHVPLQALRQAVLSLSQHIVQRLAAGLAPADVVAALASRALDELQPAPGITVKVHPEVAAAVQAHLASRAHAAALEVRPDPLLALLDCRLETPAGQWLAGLDTQLANLMHGLTESPEVSS